jgi:glycosyltransferase involved in cell wall biosynthesis
MKGKLYIYAANVHRGGGRSLLVALLRRINLRFCLFVDARIDLTHISNNDWQVEYVKPSIFARLKSEIYLKNNVTSHDAVLSFGSLPPLFKLRGHVVVFLQNRYLVDNMPSDNLPFKPRIRIILERWWLLFRLHNANEFVVQTPTMKKFLNNRTNGKVPIRVIPFADRITNTSQNLKSHICAEPSSLSFAYIASGEPHKNHLKLIEAWNLLAKEGVFPTLYLTLDRNFYPELCDEIANLGSRLGAKIINLGHLDEDRIQALYKEICALIYPSKFESFGLPLIEAREAGLAVLAPELDYVRDLVLPEQVFDPNSSVSIARAVKRFIGIKEDMVTILSGADFLSELFIKGK